ncbi:hypothetical protein F4820DRAFT_443126 [Hypoxylon rubiginosum]|uniref:Uncharacterized protein n=1 Tax=Hypoxylon rubiginosum TaxID=110542 RepID=A0ACB9ZGB3_9PEZI|nr:hypothetical protein F4820DRAFT_443126 [Hypoxylon rubiginosum]
MMYQSSVRAFALLAGLCAVSTAGIVPRTGTGPKGFLTVDDSVNSTEIQQGTLALTSDGSYSFCLSDTTASVSDCEAVLGDIRANPGSVSVAAGFCLNWYEGGCLGRVCGGTDQASYSADASWIADELASAVLDPCVRNGRSGAISDCQNIGGTCGSYHFSLQTNNM